IFTHPRPSDTPVSSVFHSHRYSPILDHPSYPCHPCSIPTNFHPSASTRHTRVIRVPFPAL
ncbi:MAG: hypothetical protein JXA03_16845, partial [Bacteroidales bacterium]|nr:hypothetical protein [Bacteroidales bacterium]